MLKKVQVLPATFHRIMYCARCARLVGKAASTDKSNMDVQFIMPSDPRFEVDAVNLPRAGKVQCHAKKCFTIHQAKIALPTRFHIEPVNALPSLGGQLTKIGLNGYQDLVTDSNKPKHNKTTTTLTNTPEEIPEQWPEHWGQIRQGDGEGNSQVLENHAATPTPPQPIGTTGCGINADTLQYPETLTAEERQEAPKKLDGLHPQIAQEVLDALAWMMANGKVKKSNIGLLVWMANKAREGTFDCTPALEWRKRQQDAQIKQSRITTVELNNLATEIKEIQRLFKESGQAMFLQQAEAMKVEYFQ